MNNQTLQDAFAQIILKATSSIEAGTEFLAAQVPDVIHQLLLWQMVKSLVVAGIALLLVIAACAWIYQTIRLTSVTSAMSVKYYDSSDVSIGREELDTAKRKSDTAQFISMFFGGFGICAAVLLIAKLLTVTQILIAPKIYLIEYATSLVK